MRLAQRLRAAERRRSGGRNQRSAEMTLILTGGAWGGGAAFDFTVGHVFLPRLTRGWLPLRRLGEQVFRAVNPSRQETMW
jgi:hypothetical protein